MNRGGSMSTAHLGGYVEYIGALECIWGIDSDCWCDTDNDDDLSSINIKGYSMKLLPILTDISKDC